MSTDETRREQGMAVRRAVLGDEHVDRANAGITELTADFQDFITRTAWGDVWSRPGLARRDRSIAVLSALITAGNFEEVPMHYRAAVRNGLTREELIEVVLQSAVYAGVPRANHAFKLLQQTLGD
ncbi:MAG: 4-carboxymuconolactone decarboxylase [Micrococcales bacterium 73-13]|nr:MAG: 4-carboxymuconolactone decarboxylase [Micrococcales bacterium 73-13]